MADRYAYTDESSELIQLASEDGRPKRFVKELFKYGTWVHPRGGGRKMKLDRAFAEKLVENFKSKVAGRSIPVPLGHPITAAELAALNRGEVVDIEAGDDRAKVIVEIRDPETADKIEKKLIQDVSMSFDEDHEDRKTGKLVGPALAHVGLVVNPYLTNMEPFGQALSSDKKLIMLSESEEPSMSAVKNDHGYKVKVEYEIDGQKKSLELEPGQEVELDEREVALVKDQVKDAKAPEPTPEEKAAAEKAAKEAADKEAADKAEADKKKGQEGETEAEKLRKENADLSAKMARRDAEDSYTKLLNEGKLVPAQKDAYMALTTAGTTQISLADGSTKPLNEQLTELFTAGHKQISFDEKGGSGSDAKTPWEALSDEERSASEAIGVGAEQYNKVHGSNTDKKE